VAFIQIPIIVPELEALMADVQDTKARVEALSTQIDEMQTRVTEDVQALKDQIAQHDIDAAVLEEINTGLDGITQRVQAIDPDPSNPASPSVDPARASWSKGNKP
jgi:methyl-accepting chemotaxis protein